jgi:hypothetical protein
MHEHASKTSSQSSLSRMAKGVALMKLFAEQEENYSLYLYVMFCGRKEYILLRSIFCVNVKKR